MALNSRNWEQPTSLSSLRSELLDFWRTGVSQEYIPAPHAKTVVGLICKRADDDDDSSPVTDQFTVSTGDMTKPGIPYPYPLMKLHKLDDAQLAAKATPPCRLVTDLSTGITARSDKYLVANWLGPLSREYCTDSVQDTTHALRNLDALSRTRTFTRGEYLTFSADIVSLYDSLKHDVVLAALDDAIATCRPSWTPPFIEWLKQLIKHGFRSAILKFGSSWLRLSRGAVCSVDLGSMAVYFVLKKLMV